MPPVLPCDILDARHGGDFPEQVRSVLRMALLDYADASAFTRAFRRWSGTTPTRWRTTRDGAPPR